MAAMTETAPEAPRIPNVRPGALSGLDNEPLAGAGVPSPAGTAPEPDEAPVLPVVPEDRTTVDALMEWVHEGEDDEDSGVDTLGRAVAVLVQEGRDGRVTLVKPLEDLLLDALVDAYVVAPEDDEDAPDPAPSVEVPDGLEGEALEAWVSGDAVEGDETENPERWAAYLARREAAGLEPLQPATITGAATITTTGAGEAVNLDTGEVTQPGQPLPTVEGTGGTPLSPPQPGADADGFGGDAPEPA